MIKGYFPTIYHNPLTCTTRRSFMKNSSLTVASALLLSQGIALSAGSGTTPCPRKVQADPNLDPWYTDYITEWGLSLKFKAITTPPGAAADSKDVAIQVEAWEATKYSTTAKWLPWISVHGTIDHKPSHVNCSFIGTPNLNHYDNLNFEEFEQDFMDPMPASGGWTNETLNIKYEYEVQYCVVMKLTNWDNDETKAFVEVFATFRKKKFEYTTDLTTNIKKGPYLRSRIDGAEWLKQTISVWKV